MRQRRRKTWHLIQLQYLSQLLLGSRPKGCMVFCVINMVNYVDRGAIAINGVNGSPRFAMRVMFVQMVVEFRVNLTLVNLKMVSYQSAFMVGLLIASLIYASLAKN